MANNYLVMNLEVCWSLKETPNIGRSIQSALDDLRGEGAARAVGFKILEGDEEYEKWYNDHGIHEVDIPVPTTVTWD